MSFTTTSKRRATAPKLPAPSLKSREAFARAAVFMEFGSRAARTLDFENFVDRRPHQTPRRINGRVAGEVA